MGPATGEVAFLGQEQLVWAQFAIDVFNDENGTSFTLVEGDTLLDPAEGATVATQLFADDSILGIVGPAGSRPRSEAISEHSVLRPTLPRTRWRQRPIRSARRVGSYPARRCLTR